MCDSNLSLAGIDQQPGNLIIFQKVHHIVVTAESSRMCCLPVVCCIPLLFPLRFYYFLTRTGQFPPINMSMASLLHEMRIVPQFFEFFETIFLHAKSTRFWRPKAHFRHQSLRFRGRVVTAKTLGTRLPLVSARGPLFRRAETTS